MGLDDLVKTIAQEVLKQLQRAPELPEVLILSPQDCANVPLLLQQLGTGAQVSYWTPERRDPGAVRMILPLLSCSQMSDLALGRASDPVMEDVLSRLLSGKPVEVFEYEYLRYRSTAPQALFGLYSSYEPILRSFGLQPFVSGIPKGSRLSQSLITERDIIEAHQRGNTILHVRSGAKLTPLALDCAKERGVQIQRTER